MRMAPYFKRHAMRGKIMIANLSTTHLAAKLEVRRDGLIPQASAASRAELQIHQEKGGEQRMVATIRKIKVVENRCRICRKPILGLPFKIHNLVCKECYGIEHYRRTELPEEPVRVENESYFSIPARRVA